MNKYIRSLVVVPFGMLKMGFTKLCHGSDFNGPMICMVSPHTEISIDKGGRLFIGKLFKMRDGAKIRVRKDAVCQIGNNTSINSNNIIACHEKIIIGNNVQLSPNVQIYDHDHDFRHSEGLKANHFRTSPVIVGNSVWIGANSIILRGSVIGDDCVIGAGSIVKGDVPAGTVYVQKRCAEITKWKNV